MIHENVKTNTMYVNNKSGQKTYFFIKTDDKLYGVRSDDRTKWQWQFGSWSSYTDPLNTNFTIEVSKTELKEMRLSAIKTLFPYMSKLQQMS